MKTIHPEHVAILPEENKIAISKEDMVLLQMAKIREEKLAKEQRIYERDKKIREHEMSVKNIQRLIAFKKEQIKKEKYLEKDESMIDGIRYKHSLENDIDSMNYQIWLREDSTRKLLEEQKKDKEE